MPYPHDYYEHLHPVGSDPHLHNKGEGRPYLEYDYHANDHGAQLPALSAIGRGPRGAGLRVGNVVQNDTETSFALYDDLTGELVWQSPNLDPGAISFAVPDFRDLSAGQPAPMDIILTRGGVTKTTHTYLPCGERGALIFLSGRIFDRNASDTYQTTVSDLTIYGIRERKPNRPDPKVNDIVFFQWRKDGETGIGFGTVEAVGTASETAISDSSPVVFTSHTHVPCTLQGGGGGDVEPLIVECTMAQAVKTEKTDSEQYILTAHEEAQVMFEAFASGRPVLLHYWNDYYKVVSACIVPHVPQLQLIAPTDVRSNKYYRFLIAVENPYDFNTGYISKSNETKATEEPAFVLPANGYTGCNCEPLIVETHFDAVPNGFLRSANTRSSSTNIALCCEETAGVMYEAFIEGRPVLLRVYNNSNDIKATIDYSFERYLKVVSASVSDVFSFVVVDAHGSTGQNPVAIGSYNATSSDDYPYFAEPDETGPFVIVLTEETVGYETRYMFNRIASEVFHAYIDTNTKVIFAYYNGTLDRTGYYDLIGMRIDNANDKYFFEIDAGFMMETGANDIWSIEAASNDYPYFSSAEINQ